MARHNKPGAAIGKKNTASLLERDARRHHPL